MSFIPTHTLTHTHTHTHTPPHRSQERECRVGGGEQVSQGLYRAAAAQHHGQQAGHFGVW